MGTPFRTAGTTFFSLLNVAILVLTLSGCTDRIYKQSLARNWDCGTYQLALEIDGRYSLVASAFNQHYSGTYQIDEAPGGGHTIKWSGEANAFTKENTFIVGPSSDREMALGRDAGRTGTFCVGRKMN